MNAASEDRTSQIGLLLRRFSWRHWTREWRSTLLLVGILALGVGVFLSIRLANRAAVSGFSLFTESISGESDFVLRPAAGTTIPVSELAPLRDRLDPIPVALFPVIESGVASVSGETGTVQSRRLVGVDLVAVQNALSLGMGAAPMGLYEQSQGEEGFRLGSPDHGFVPAAWAEASGVRAGDEIVLLVNDRRVALTIAGLLEGDPNRPAIPENLVLMDLPGAQALLGLEGEISRIELVLAPGENREADRVDVARRLGGAKPDAWVWETRDDRRSSASQMTAAFRMNLTVLSTLALLVGTYLILQALEAAVVRRRSEIAVMRSLGVSPAVIRRLWLTESLVLGTAGSGLGVLVGWAGAQVTVGAISRTVNSLYYATTTNAATLHPGEALVAFVFGVVASVVAGWLPAREAAATPPAQILRTGHRDPGARLLRHRGLGVGLALAALLLGQLPPWTGESGTRVPIGGYLAAAAWLLAVSILAGGLFPLMSRAGLEGLRRFAPGFYAASQLRRASGRHRLAVAGLVTAVGMAAGMGILVHSFEGTLTGWIGQLLRADLYVATAGGDQAANSNTIRAETWTEMGKDEAVEGIDVIRRYPVVYRGRQIQLAGSEYHHRSDRGLRFTWLEEPEDPDPRSLAEARVSDEVPAWINEPFSRRFGVGRGDKLEIPTPGGIRSFVVEGVYADYSDEAGTVLVNRLYTARWFDDGSVSNVAVYLREGSDPEQLVERWRETHPALVVRENARLRAEALRVFHQTFAVTYALEVIGVVVAVVGLGMALASLMMERTAELRTLKSVGCTRGQIASASAVEGAAVAVVGLLGGLVLSLILGRLLIFVINRQSFGWTLDFRVPWGLLGGLALLTLLTSAGIAAAVGRRGARLRSDPEE